LVVLISNAITELTFLKGIWKKWGAGGYRQHLTWIHQRINHRLPRGVD